MGPIAGAQQNFAGSGGITPNYNTTPTSNTTSMAQTASSPSSNGSFWVGNDGNVYVAGSQGTHSAGAADANTANYWSGQGFNQIADPLASSGATSSASGSYGNSNPALAAAIGQSADNTINQSNNMESLLNGGNHDAVNDINGIYGAQKNTLDQQNGNAQFNLQQGQNKLNTSSANSFRDLVNQMRGSMSGYANMLGTQGAGNSSATNLINYYLQQQGNQNLGDLNQQVAQQQTDLSGATKSVKDAYETQLMNLDASHKQALDQLGLFYNQTIAGLEANKQNAGTYKAQMLATYGLQQAAQQGLANLANLNASYNDKIANLKNSYTNITPVDTSAFNNLPNPQGVNANQYNLSSYSGTQVTPQQVTSPVSIFKNNNNNTLTY